jgi:prepilin-type N-terminal cleavage/methylation domain-containing protein
MKHIRSNTSHTSEEGFTIIELLISLAVFSFVLVIITVGFIQILASYDRGVYRKTVDDDARFLMTDMVSKIRTISSASQVNTSQIANGRLCFGGYSYVWNPVIPPRGWVENVVNGQDVTIVRIDGDTGATMCKAGAINVNTSYASSVFNNQVGVQSISVQSVGGLPDLLQITIEATSTTYESDPTQCVAGATGSQYCSNITLTQIVGLRNE